jgi:NADPH:quinone reductase-like Zn-dependent oxidoreductase
VKAVTRSRYGGPEVLTVRELEEPEPGEGQVRVRVAATSLNMFDWHMITGTPLLARLDAGLRRPKSPIPGADIAGVVDAVGPEVDGVELGTRLFGCVGAGGLAEKVRVKAAKLAVIPEGVSFEEASTIPIAGLTALQGLRDHAGLEAGQRVLVNGASGGVGTFAVQIAKALGAEVTAVCSTGKVEMVRSLGADRVIDYKTDDFTETERGYDVLFDNAGLRPWSQTSRVLGPTGINVTVTGPKHALAGPLRNNLFRQVRSAFDGRRFKWFVSSVKREDLDALAAMVASGQVRPVIERTYPLEQAADAVRYLGEGHVAGKLVIVN